MYEGNASADSAPCLRIPWLPLSVMLVGTSFVVVDAVIDIRECTVVEISIRGPEVVCDEGTVVELEVAVFVKAECD